MPQHVDDEDLDEIGVKRGHKKRLLRKIQPPQQQQQVCVFDDGSERPRANVVCSFSQAHVPPPHGEVQGADVAPLAMSAASTNT